MSCAESCKCTSSSTSSGIQLPKQFEGANESRKNGDDKKKNSKARPTSEGDSCFSFQGSGTNPECDKVCYPISRSKAIVGRPAPHFEGKAAYKCEFVDLALCDYLGKYVVLVFYALDFTLVCPSEIIAFSDRIDEFKKINTEVIACSVDSHFTHLAWINTPRPDGGVGKVKLPLLSDISHKMSKDYGVYVPEWGHSLRGLFIIDDRGILRQITVNDLPVTRSVDETLRLVKLFQFTDTHDEVCSNSLI